MVSPEARVIMAPNPYTKTGPTIFLSGSIDTPPQTWQHKLTTYLSSLSPSPFSIPLTVLNPHREDWDSTWVEDPSCQKFYQQTQWELEGMENADVIAVFLGKEAKAPISMMEMGLWARSGKCVVCCSKEFWKQGNVRVVCERYGVRVVETVEELGMAVVERLREVCGGVVEAGREKGGK
jgi:hypothetical protein